MKVNDFSKRLGICSSKVRYYDRIGLIKGNRCEENNYRDFTDLDALNIYHAQMLRSFDMSVQESLAAKQKGLAEISQWVEEHVSELELLIRQEEMRLYRLREMQDYFLLIEKSKSVLTEHNLDDNYNVFNFGSCAKCDATTSKAIEILADVMPFSYIAIKVSKESLFDAEKPLAVSIGLGILERNRKKLNLTLPKEIERTKGCKILQILILCADPFHLNRSYLAPLFEEVERRQLTITDDLVGRIYMSYQEGDTFLHGIGLSVPIENEK